MKVLVYTFNGLLDNVKDAKTGEDIEFEEVEF